MTFKALTAVVYKEGRWYVAECPEIGTASQGKTFDEAVANLKEATERYIEATNSELAQLVKFVGVLGEHEPDEAMRDAEAGRNLIGPFDSAEALFAALQRS